MTITTARIFEIADNLDAIGQNPTLASVRKALGGGSYTTISQAMAEWRAKKSAKETTTREVPPPAVTEMLEQLGAELWTHAIQMANARLAAEREALEKDRQDLEAQRREAAELADQVSAELEAAKTEAATLRTQIEAERTQSRTLADAVRDRERDLAVAQARTEEVNTRADQLNQQLAAATAQNAELVRAIAELKPAPKDSKKG